MQRWTEIPSQHGPVLHQDTEGLVLSAQKA